MSEFTLRPTVIGGETTPDDYTVIHDGRLAGRIRLASERAAHGEVWTWSVTIPMPTPPDCGGVESSFDDAKAAFYASLTPEQIQRWHHTADLVERNKSW